MAFTDQEKEVITWGRANGKTPQEIETAVARLRSGYTPPPPQEPSVASQVATGFVKGTKEQLASVGDMAAKGADIMFLGPIGQQLKPFQRATDKLQEVVALDTNTKASTTGEKVGKGLSYAASLLIPSGGAQKVATLAKEGAKDVASLAAKSVPNFSQDLVYQASTPKITQKVAVQAAKSGKVQPNTLLKSGEILLSPRQQQIKATVEPVLADVSDPIEAITKLSARITSLDEQATKLATDVNPIFNTNQLRSYLSKVKDENRLVFASDPQAEKVYDAVIDALVSEVKQGNTKALFEARKSFDKLPAVQKLLNSSPLGENLRREAVLDVRRAANDYLQELLPEGDQFRVLLKEESLMFDAINNLATKYAKDALTKSKLRQAIDKVPFIRDILQGVLPAGAVSAGLKAID